MDLDAILQRGPSWCWSTNWPTPTRRAAAIPSAISTWRSCSGGHRRLHHRQYPAHRELERRRCADHTHPRSRDASGRGSRFADEIELVDPTSDDLLQRLREGKVYVKAQAERALAPFLLAGQSHGACANSRCAKRPSTSTATWSTICRRTPSAALGRPANASWCASANIRLAPSWCAAREDLRIASRPAGPRSMSRARGTWG